MKYYQEIKLLEQSDISPYFIWSKLYAQLHLAFVECKDKNQEVSVGVSFPEYQFDTEKDFGRLGTKLRLFGKDQQSLLALDLPKWCTLLQDYLHITSIREVPHKAITGYGTFARKQVKSNPERLARRRAKKDTSISYEAALLLYKQGAMTSNLPYIQLNSLSNSHPFKLFIECKLFEKEQNGLFNCFGLSNTATVPLFH